MIWERLPERHWRRATTDEVIPPSYPVREAR
jgi:hypothetical protein